MVGKPTLNELVPMRSATVLVVLTLMGTGIAEAQKTGPEVIGKVRQGAIGNEARIWTNAHPGQLFEGKLIRWDADSVSLLPVREPTSWQNRQLSIPTTALTMMEVQHIRTPSEGFSRGLRKGAVFGLFAGAAIGLLLSDLQKDNAIPIAIATGVGGVMVYAAYGYLAPGSEWEQVHPQTSSGIMQPIR